MIVPTKSVALMTRPFANQNFKLPKNGYLLAGVKVLAADDDKRDCSTAWFPESRADKN